ncbi:uncharacterized protein LOC124144093 [Haliotis rufescens]|uniref:uncharacterized protein LOC124144093 n=1 Tax=Haliotis rufescens TaxID=6454 RepID=UPI00201F9C76|nr:uncharacterized protein LOC124144093 [Haliotis rufescens]
MTSVTQVNLTGREETDNTQWYIILPGALGGLAVVSLVIFLVWRNRTSRKRNLPRLIQKNRSDSQEDILEMQDNPAYWTSMQAAKSTSSQSEDAEEQEKIEMQDNPVYWKSSHAVKDHSTQLADAEKEDNHVYWTPSLDTGDNSTQLADAEKQVNPVYWTLEPHCHGPPHTAGQRKEEC